MHNCLSETWGFIFRLISSGIWKRHTHAKCCCCCAVGLKFSHTGVVSHVLQARLQLFRGPCIGDVLWEGGHHPVPSIMLFFCLSVPDSIEKKSEIKRPSFLHWRSCGVVLGSANKICALCLCFGADWSTPSTGGHFLPPCVYAPVKDPCQQPLGRISPGKVHLDARCFIAPVTHPHINQTFKNFSGHLWGRLVGYLYTFVVLGVPCFVQNELSPQGDSKD